MTMQATDAATYFWSGSNGSGEIAALAKHRQPIGVAVCDLHGDALQTLLGLAPERPALRIVAGVTRNSSGQPIVMFNRERRQHSSLPVGDTTVDVAGRRVDVGFRKVAANVARAVAGGANVLGELLRELFGADAGARGAGHRVAIELTSAGWQMSDAQLDALAANGSPVFVDSGAFSEVEFNAPHKCGRGKACKGGTCIGNGSLPRPDAPAFTFPTAIDGKGDSCEITDADWHERLDAYERIAERLGSLAYLVAPDRVGDQAETLRRLRVFGDRVRRLRAMGANIIVPLQRGAVSQIEFDAQVQSALGFADYVRGIPSKKAATTTAEVAELSRQLPADCRVHLLGLGPWSPRWAEVIAALDRPAELVLCDSVRIRAMAGRRNGRGGGPRILTVLRDAACELFGLPIGKQLAPADSYRVKLEALDRYFSDYFAAETAV